jgi:type IV secretory pathway VirB10-like protein
MAKKVELAKLAKTAEELNVVLGCNPAIKVKGANEASLVKALTEASALIDKENDEFTPATVKVLKDLDIWDNIPEGEDDEVDDDEDDTPPAPAPKKKAAPAPAPAPKKKAVPIVEDDDDEDEEENDDEQAPVPAKKGKAAPAPAPKKGKAAPVEDDDDEDEEVEETPKVKKAFGAIGDPTSQTGVIRASIKKGKTKEQIEALLSKKFEKSEGWGKARFTLYEKSYGTMGANDKNI